MRALTLVLSYCVISCLLISCQRNSEKSASSDQVSDLVVDSASSDALSQDQMVALAKETQLFLINMDVLRKNSAQRDKSYAEIFHNKKYDELLSRWDRAPNQDHACRFALLYGSVFASSFKGETEGLLSHECVERSLSVYQKEMKACNEQLVNH